MEFCKKCFSGREPINCSALCESILQERYSQLCELVLAISKNTALCKNSHIQNVIINLLPRLAAANREKFVTDYLEETMVYINRCLQGNYQLYLDKHPHFVHELCLLMFKAYPVKQ